MGLYRMQDLYLVGSLSQHLMKNGTLPAAKKPLPCDSNWVRVCILFQALLSSNVGSVSAEDDALNHACSVGGRRALGLWGMTDFLRTDGCDDEEAWV